MLRIRVAVSGFLALGLLAALAGQPAEPARAGDTSAFGLVQGEPIRVRSDYLEGELRVPPGVFATAEAEQTVLPLMYANRELFRGSSVLEIGAGSGINSVYAAQLGARRVVATDINELAVQTIRRNAANLGYASVVEARLVPRSDMSAYSVIGPDERFDVILSNPPYALDLDASQNDAVRDKGDLGFSIVRGLDRHLAEDGVALLLYGSMFYHHVMVKYARHSGYAVRQRDPALLVPWESESLYNAYLGRLLRREGVDPDALRFHYEHDRAATSLWSRNRPGTWARIEAWLRRTVPLPAADPDTPALINPGWIAIQRSPDTETSVSAAR